MTDTPKPLTADEVARFKSGERVIGPWEGQRLIATVEQQAEQIEKLRAALEKIAIFGEQGMEPDYTSWLTFHDKIAEISREALAATEPVND